MSVQRLASVLGILCLGLVLATATVARTQQEGPPPAPDQQQDQDTEVLARGPIHEAFADPVNPKPQPTKIVPKAPPPPIEEVPPDQKPAGENVQWFPGYWSWDEDRTDFIWVSGIWRVPPPGRNWVPGHWTNVDNGAQWTPGFWMVLQQDQDTNNQGADTVEYLPPPPEPVAAAASIPAPNDQSTFVPGVWVYRDTRYLWRPGFWIDYRPGWVWIPAHYVWTPIGYVFVEGYWDLELTRRGLVFAPVFFRRPLWEVDSWSYRPRYLVYEDFIRTCLFLRPGWNSYYFGDYFEPGYRRRGFVPFIDYRIGNFGYDPLYSYYRWQHREDRRPVTDLRELYAARFNGTAARPPVTLVQQNTLIQNFNNNGVTNVTNVQHVTALAALNNVNRNVLRLQPVPQAQLQQEQKFAQTMRQASLNRSRSEGQLLATHGTAVAPQAKPITANLSVPKPRVPNNAVAGVKPPPAPAVAHPTTPAARPELARPATPGRSETHPTTTPVPPGRTEHAPAPPPKTGPRPEPRPPARVEPRPEPRPPVKTEARPEPRPQPHAEPPMPPARVESRPEPRPPAKTEARPEPRPQPHAEPPMPPPRPPALAPRPERPPEKKAPEKKQ